MLVAAMEDVADTLTAITAMENFLIIFSILYRPWLGEDANRLVP
jgi:hypothetical protein